VAESLAYCPSSASRMERLADHQSSVSSFPMMPRRMDSVYRRSAGSTDSSIKTTASDASEARQFLGASSRMPASSRSHRSVQVPALSSGLPSTTRGGYAFNVTAGPPLTPQRFDSIHHQPMSYHTTQSAPPPAPASPREDSDHHNHRKIQHPTTPKPFKEHDDSFRRLPLRRVSPLRRLDYVIAVKPQAPYNKNNSIQMTGSSSISTTSTTSPSQEQEHPVVPAAPRDPAPRDPQREDIFGPPPMPERRQSMLTAPNVDEHHHDQQKEQEESKIMIEVAAGVKIPLRGKSETWSAIEEGAVTVTMCVICNMDLNCIFDAQMVICPDCLCVSPVDQTEQDSTSAASMHRHGVGVGIKGEEILRWVMGNSS
jgi:hypothetical protein